MCEKFMCAQIKFFSDQSVVNSVVTPQFSIGYNLIESLTKHILYNKKVRATGSNFAD